jgi:hypothetical protein
MTVLDKTHSSDSKPTLPTRFRNLAWGVATIVTGSFVVALLKETELMDGAVRISLSWLAALAAIIVGLTLIFRHTPDSGTSSTTP